MSDTVRLTIPAKPEYMVCLRLTASCVAERADFDIESIEDIKTAVAEAGLQLLQISENHSLDIQFRLEAGISVELATESRLAPSNSPETEISAFLLEAMMDSVVFVQEHGISKYILVKSR